MSMWKHHFICFHAIAKQYPYLLQVLIQNLRRGEGARVAREGAAAPHPAPPLARALPLIFLENWNMININNNNAAII